jgi:small neutral amino acid transporter SnatA (MarC family)
MLFARPHGAFTITGAETSKARHKDDIVVFPLAIPLQAGPGAISAAIILAAKVNGDATGMAVVLCALLAVTLGTIYERAISGSIRCYRLGNRSNVCSPSGIWWNSCLSMV